MLLTHNFVPVCVYTFYSALRALHKIGSPTALADPQVQKALFETASKCHGLYVPAGALWGGQDIQKMADRGTLKVCCM